MPFDFKEFDVKCSAMTAEELQKEWEHYTRLISGAATSTAVSGVAMPFTLGVSAIGIGLAAPAIHNARKKREIIEMHLNRHGTKHSTRKRDVLTPMAISGTVGVVTLGVGSIGADAITNQAVEHGVYAIAEQELLVKATTHLAVDAAAMAGEEAHMKKKKAAEACKPAQMPVALSTYPGTAPSISHGASNPWTSLPAQQSTSLDSKSPYLDPNPQPNPHLSMPSTPIPPPYMPDRPDLEIYNAPKSDSISYFPQPPTPQQPGNQCYPTPTYTPVVRPPFLNGDSTSMNYTSSISSQMSQLHLGNTNYPPPPPPPPTSTYSEHKLTMSPSPLPPSASPFSPNSNLSQSYRPPFQTSTLSPPQSVCGSQAPPNFYTSPAPQSFYPTPVPTPQAESNQYFPPPPQSPNPTPQTDSKPQYSAQPPQNFYPTPMATPQTDSKPQYSVQPPQNFYPTPIATPQQYFPSSPQSFYSTTGPTLASSRPTESIPYFPPPPGVPFAKST
ncbi:hypothetical protein GJ744_003695 [Endocarpon pusillum]|uniref:Uncharacterized protein n=1 Tax=Endocarpon pusillum TaxID=364733 RepID=A0A8H7A8T5_9EURO|nr:hypothetical protein GJ744_003695 [Endocarpon pusillum]